MREFSRQSRSRSCKYIKKLKVLSLIGAKLACFLLLLVKLASKRRKKLDLTVSSLFSAQSLITNCAELSFAPAYVLCFALFKYYPPHS